ncbi:MAG: D-alanine--D-alanine ligase [Clostridia bacterium]|nr:D-alanine--D-alanine ligase [Clostridia bacterium]
MKIQLAVLFGGKSVEHEISIISAIQAIHHLDKEKYDVIPVYMTKSADFYTGADVDKIESYRDVSALLARSKRVIFVKDGDRVYLTDHPHDKRFRREKKEIDVVFPVVHGTNVEDGTLQGYLKTLGVPFVGCDVTASAIGMDKHVMKAVLRDFGLPVLDCKVYGKTDYLTDREQILNGIKAAFSYPVIVKPVNLGSSIGISKANDDNELADAIDLAFSFANRVLVEHAITALREINCAVIGDGDEAIASECEEPLNATTILSYEDKYLGNASGKSGSKGAKSGGSQGMASLSRQIPADISKEMREEIRSLAVRTFQALGCNGVSRVDLMLDGDENKIYVNEINTIPGSLSFYLWEPIGIPYDKLLDRMIQLALKRVRDEKTVTYAFDTSVLSNCTSDALGGAKGSKR